MTHDEIVTALTHDHPQYHDVYRQRHKRHKPGLHTYRTPIPARYEPRTVVDQLHAPGTEDPDFPGCIF